MAYNPGVSDISGQLRAQGMTRGMNSLLEGFDVGIKTYQQNKHIADTSIAKFGAAVANSDELKKLLTDENERSKLPSDVVKAYLKLNKEGSLGVREASLLGGFARSFLENAKAKQQQAYQAKMMANVDQQIAASQQAGILARAQSAREQAAAGRAQGMYDRNIKAVEDLRTIVGTADNLNAGYPIEFPARPMSGPASFGSYKDALGAAPLPVQAAVRSENAFIPYVPPPASQVPNSPLRSGTTTPTPNVDVLEEYRNKRDYVPVAGNMGGGGVLTVQAADRIKRKAADLEDTSLGQMIRAGITPTDEMMGNSVLRDSTNQIAAVRATNAAAAQQAKNELQALMLEMKEVQLNQDPTPIIRSIKRAVKDGIFTEAEGNKYISDVVIKAGTVPKAIEDLVAGAVRTAMGDKGGGAGAGGAGAGGAAAGGAAAGGAAATKLQDIPRVGSSPEELQTVPLDSEFFSLDGKLRYKDKAGRLHLGGRPTK